MCPMAIKSHLFVDLDPSIDALSAADSGLINGLEVICQPKINLDVRVFSTDMASPATSDGYIFEFENVSPGQTISGHSRYVAIR